MKCVEFLEEACARAGLKITEPRKAILRVLGGTDDHPSVDEVYARAKEIDPSISLATVYRTLSTLEELGLVIHHAFKDNASRYELKHSHHHHIVDVETHDVVEFKDDRLETLMAEILAEKGFDMICHRIELYGRKKTA